MNRLPTATLWLFAYHGLSVATHVAIVQELAGWPNLRHAALGEESLISRGRSRVATKFLQDASGGDVLLMVDEDIAWQPGDLGLLARRALERNAVVGGIYPKRGFGDGSACRFADNGEWTIGEDRVISADYVGSGFVAIPRACLAAVCKDLPWIEEGYWPFFLPIAVLTEQGGRGGHEYLSEDWAFCHRARAAGFKVLASTGPRLTHEGRYTFRLVDTRVRPPADEAITVRLGTAAAAQAGKPGG